MRYNRCRLLNDASDCIRRSARTAHTSGQGCREDGLLDGGCDGYADYLAEGAEEVAGGDGEGEFVCLQH